MTWTMTYKWNIYTYKTDQLLYQQATTAILDVIYWCGMHSMIYMLNYGANYECKTSQFVPFY
jgi:hypothetical protein